MPAAERQREFITCWIGAYPTRKGADVGQEAVGMGKVRFFNGWEKIGAEFLLSNRNQSEQMLRESRPGRKSTAQEPCAVKVASTVP